MYCTRLLAVSAILAITTAIHPCYSAGWEGRPWADNTNAPTWQALQADYAPFEQLFNALVERADVVRATVNTNFPRLELVQTWTVDVCSVTKENSASTNIIASGFPLAGGVDLNGTYTYVDDENYMRSDGEYVFKDITTTWYIGYYDYESPTGPESTTWYSGGLVPGAKTVLSIVPEGTTVDIITTNVTTTNAFAPFPYSVEYDGTTYSGTGFPHLTYAAMEWIDQQIENLSEYYAPILPPTNLPPSGASVWLWQDDWDAHGKYSLIGGADVGKTESGTYVTVSTNRYGTVITTTNDWEISAYTRQPPVTSQWIMAEWVWGPTNWVEEVVGGETNWVAEMGWAGDYYVTEMDMRLPLGTNGPLVEAYSATNGAPISVTVELHGNVKKDHWYNAAGVVTGVVESVDSGDTATNLWHSLRTGTKITAGSGTATGDYVIVSYKGPIVLYGTRPYRLYASDLDERAAVIDMLHNMPIEHAWTDYYYSTANRVIPMWTNALYLSDYQVDNTERSYVISSTNDPVHPPWSDIIPHPFVQQDFIAATGATVFLPDYQEWGTYSITRSSELVVISGVTNLSNSVSVSVSDGHAAKLMYSLEFTTNTVQGTNFPSSFLIRNPVPCWSGNNLYSPATAAFANDQPFDFHEVYEAGVNYPASTNYNFRIQVTSDEHTIAAGTNYYTSGLIGPATFQDGVIPYNIYRDPLTGTTVIPWQSVTEVDAGETFSAGISWLPYWDDKEYEGDLNFKPIPGFIDWGTTNGFRYRAAD